MGGGCQGNVISHFLPPITGFGEEKKTLLRNKLVLTVSKHMHLFL